MGYGSPLTSFNANATPMETAALFPPYNSTLPMDHSFPKAAPVLPTSTGVVMKSDSDGEGENGSGGETEERSEENNGGNRVGDDEDIEE
ncbi:putative BOI-related E3 ubiquitin-protein ligase 2 isoform X1 [Cucumis melo var. makuwa]|uniref:BOI-related E3 ubiquitin-protein ligase 2 isoform X1 n=1 Tax=Cucumis melo var. makuwa TaxID=1194695 RepID=A0A5A7UK43_CUCMM|nr:putative BOI-related E3 ubiquitin-protein ligase 2 isoform X1 [Cucumis melo var. makuwa]